MNYQDFIKSKSQYSDMSGFDPLWLPDFLFDFQRHLLEWSIRKGRAAIFADCGLGKTPMQLVWAENVVRKTNGRVLILTPIAVGAQTVKEAEKFGVEATRSRDGKFSESSKIIVTNYEQLEKFTPSDFVGCVCDESQIFKNFNGKTKEQAIEFMRMLPYRLLCSATPSPNDFVELGNSSESLGELGFQDMATRFFVKETKKDYLGWGRNSYRLRTHAEKGFWQWVCSWARAIRRPSDLGYCDRNFNLPSLITNEHEVKTSKPAPGRLFDVPAENLHEQREEQRRTIVERCEKAAELCNRDEPSVLWCYLNDEGDLLEELVKGAKQVSGSDSDEEKEETFLAFSSGQLKKLVVKPKIGALGMNWQHCNHMTFFPSHSFEQIYQGTRRCWRFGQKNDVTADMIVTEGGAKVFASYNRKAEQAERMFAMLIENMNESLQIQATQYGTTNMESPLWARK